MQYFVHSVVSYRALSRWHIFLRSLSKKFPRHSEAKTGWSLGNLIKTSSTVNDFQETSIVHTRDNPSRKALPEKMSHAVRPVI